MAFRRHARELPDLEIGRPLKHKPAGSPAPPKLIFTEPIDRTAHLFAEEPAGPAPLDQSGVQAVPLPDSSFVLRVRVVEPKRGISGLRLLQGAVAFVSIIVLVLLLYPPEPRRSPQGTAPPTIVSAPDPGPVSAPAEPSPPRSSPVPLPSYYLKREATSPPSKPRAKDAPAPATRAGAAGTPPGGETRSIPMLNVQRLGDEGDSLVGAPIAGPVIENPIVARGDRDAATRDERAGNRPAAAPPGAGATVDGAARERDIRQILSRYQAAYSSLDADEAARVYPAIDRKALSRAFSALDSQRIQLEDCRVELRSTSARATCGGSASWKPKVGGVSRAQARRWQFDLKQVGAAWQIGSVTIQ